MSKPTRRNARQHSLDHRGDMSAELRRAHLIAIVRLIINDLIRSEGSVPSKTTSGTQHKVKLANRCGARADGVRPHPVLQQGRAEAFIEQDRRCGLADRTEGCHAHAPRSCPAHPQRKRSRVPKTRRFRHSVPRLSSISDAWGRLNVVTPFHHLSGDSHLHPSLAVQGPLRHLAESSGLWPRLGAGCNPIESDSLVGERKTRPFQKGGLPAGRIRPLAKGPSAKARRVCGGPSYFWWQRMRLGERLTIQDEKKVLPPCVTAVRRTPVSRRMNS